MYRTKLVHYFITAALAATLSFAMFGAVHAETLNEETVTEETEENEETLTLKVRCYANARYDANYVGRITSDTLLDTEIVVKGKPGDTYTFTEEDIETEMPDGMILVDRMEPATLTFGEYPDWEYVHLRATYPMTVTFSYVADGEIVGRQYIEETREEAIERASKDYPMQIILEDLDLPEGYETEFSDGQQVVYTIFDPGSAVELYHSDLDLQVKKISSDDASDDAGDEVIEDDSDIQESEATYEDAVLIIVYKFSDIEISRQEVRASGKVGESYTFTALNTDLKIPDGYEQIERMRTVNVEYGGHDYITVHLGRGNKADTSSALPSYVVKGNWTQTADGQWRFTDNYGEVYKERWAAVENPYANVAQGQSAFDWFRFDAEGNMMTGWFQDVDQNWYYLNPASDGTRGKMMTGWTWIMDPDGITRCYYFNPNSDGVRGKMITNTVIDGNTLDINGHWTVNGIVQTR